MNPNYARQKNSERLNEVESVNRYLNIQLPSVFDNDLVFTIANNERDMEEAYRLVYTEYLREGYTSYKDHGIHLSKFHAHPLSTTFIGKFKGKVIITMSIFVDSEIGLPMDILYSKELDTFRKQNRLLVEVGCFASNRNYRKNDQVLPIMLNNIMQRYVREHLNADDLIITVNPKHVLFYTNALLFQKIGETKDYSTVNNHPAVLLRSNLHTFQDDLYNLYKDSPPQTNIHDFFFCRKVDNYNLPEDNQIVTIYNKQLFNYFYNNRTDIGSKITEEDILKISSIYRKFEMFKNLKIA